MKLQGITDSGLRRIAQGLSPELQQLADALANEDAGWFVHASDTPLLERQTGYVTECVPAVEYNRVLHYGEYMNFVFDVGSVLIDDILDEVVGALQADYGADALSPELDSIVSGGDWVGLAEEINPENIVASAEMWDSPDFVSWFSEKFSQYNMLITHDGAVVLDPGLLTAVISATHAELDQIEEVLW